jgi:hypothetical protein
MTFKDEGRLPPKAGVFAEGQAAVVAAAIVAGQAGYQRDLHGGKPPTRTFEGPSTDLTGGKSEFGATRIQRWLGRDAPNADQSARAIPTPPSPSSRLRARPIARRRLTALLSRRDQM